MAYVRLYLLDRWWTVVVIKLENSGRGWAGWEWNLGRVRAVMKQGRMLLGSLMNLIRCLLGDALSKIRFVLDSGLWQVPPILQ